MAINTIAKASVLQTMLDEQVSQQAATSWMELNNDMVKYTGGAEVKIPKITLGGLGDYDRDTGYPNGAVNLAYETRTMTKDRAKSFLLDAMDVEETNFVANASAVMGVFQREKVIPEVDAYRISALAGMATASMTEVVTLTASNVYGKLIDHLTAVRDAVGAGTELVVQLSELVFALLAKSSEFTRSVSMLDFASGNISTRVRAIDGVPLLGTPSARMKTAYTYYDGRTASDGAETNPTPDQRGGGFVATSAAKDINWLVLPKRAPIVVCKTDTVRIFDPSTTQKANAWQIDYRKFHDLWVLYNMKPNIFLCKKA